MINQAERLKTEFNNLGVDIDIISNGFSRVQVDGKDTLIDIGAPDFAIYLDKDKVITNFDDNFAVCMYL